MASLEREELELHGNTSSGNLHEDLENRTGCKSTEGNLERCVWTLCAAVSIGTTKYILVDLNFHYPLHLVIIQLVAAGTVTLCFRATRLENIITATNGTGNRSWLFGMTLSGLEALSLAFSTQAILHFPNLSTLAMLPVGPLHNPSLDRC